MLTIDLVMSWNPCKEYTLERVEELFAGREALTPQEVAALDIPAKDKLWVLLRGEILPAEVLHELACKFAERPLLRERDAGREPDPRSWKAIEAKRAWLRGEINNEELEVARDAAGAAWAATRNAAWDAAMAATEAAVGAPAWDIAWATAGVTARDAASAGFGDAEHEWQLARVLEVLPRQTRKLNVEIERKTWEFLTQEAARCQTSSGTVLDKTIEAVLDFIEDGYILPMEVEKEHKP